MQPVDFMSIGDLAASSGISIDTIRVWERRYGRPTPHRLPSGHRRYSNEHVRWLRRVAEALALGHRPGKVVPLGDDELTTLLESSQRQHTDDPRILGLLGLVREFKGRDLRRALREQLSNSRPRDFIIEIIAPLVTAVGRLWADGALEVRHEHYLSEILETFLRGLRDELPLDEAAPVVLFATLPGEPHGLGLQMAATYCVLCGANPAVLGPDLPIDELVLAARETKAVGVALSVSLATGGVDTDRKLSGLRAQLDEGIRLIIGGAGARGVRRGPRGVEYMDGLEGFEKWLKETILSGAVAGTLGSANTSQA